MSKISVGHPNLGLTLFIVSRLPNALDDAVHDLIDISAFYPYVFCTRFVMTSDNRLLDNDRRRGNHNRSRCDYGRLRYHNCRGAGGFINRRGDETCSKYSCSNSNSLAVSMMMMTMVMARRRRRRPMSTTGRTRGGTYAHCQRSGKRQCQNISHGGISLFNDYNLSLKNIADYKPFHHTMQRFLPFIFYFALTSAITEKIKRRSDIIEKQTIRTGIDSSTPIKPCNCRRTA